MVICKTPSRNHTLCHILGVFVKRNFNIDPEALNFDTHALRPYKLDITCLLWAGVIREEGGKYHFYEPGEAPEEMRNLSGAEAKNARKLEMRLAKLDDIEQRLKDVEETTYKTMRSQIQMLTMLNQSQQYQGDGFGLSRTFLYVS